MFYFSAKKGTHELAPAERRVPTGRELGRLQRSAGVTAESLSQRIKLRAASLLPCISGNIANVGDAQRPARGAELEARLPLARDHERLHLPAAVQR